MQEHDNSSEVSRRQFIKSSVLSASVLTMAGQSRIFAAGDEKVKIGLIGCGGRGTGAVIDCMNADPQVELVAMADLFADRLDGSLKELKKQFPDRVKVTPETSYVGFDAYQKVIATDGVVLVLVAPIPHFSSIIVKAAVEAGKHVFVEKPGATDPVGVRRLMAAAEIADQKGLSIVAGTQRRHAPNYLETLKRIQDGQIGQIVAAQCYWCGGDMIGYWRWWERNECKTDMEWQCRSWPWFVWTSGDHVVEQHLHNVDVINWAMGAHPVSAMGMGGRQVRTQGVIWDHFAVEFEYPGGVRVSSYCRQINGCASNVSERVVGTEGSAMCDGTIYGKKPYKYEGENVNPYVQEHVDLIRSIRTGQPINEGKRLAESAMSVILGRMSAYTGQALRWDWVMNNSKQDLAPAAYQWGALPTPEVAMPGKTPIV